MSETTCPRGHERTPETCRKTAKGVECLVCRGVRRAEKHRTYLEAMAEWGRREMILLEQREEMRARTLVIEEQLAAHHAARPNGKGEKEDDQ